MAHEDAGHYGAKHPADRKLNEKSLGPFGKKHGRKISCAEASRIAGPASGEHGGCWRDRLTF